MYRTMEWVARGKGIWMEEVWGFSRNWKRFERVCVLLASNMANCCGEWDCSLEGSGTESRGTRRSLRSGCKMRLERLSNAVCNVHYCSWLKTCYMVCWSQRFWFCSDLAVVSSIVGSGGWLSIWQAWIGPGLLDEGSRRHQVLFLLSLSVRTRRDAFSL